MNWPSLNKRGPIKLKSIQLILVLIQFFVNKNQQLSYQVVL